MANNYRPDPFRDLFDENELSSLFDEEDEEMVSTDEFGDDDLETCHGCGGKGKYQGLFELEDPCQVCGGTGCVENDTRDEFPRVPASGS